MSKIKFTGTDTHKGFDHYRCTVCGRKDYFATYDTIDQMECFPGCDYNLNDIEFNTLVFVGRMQPFHKGHKAVIDEALTWAHQVVVVLGSAHQPRSIKNPWTVSERRDMIRSAYRDRPDLQDRIDITHVMDYPYDDNAWVSAVQNAVNKVQKVKDTSLGTGLIGHSKDHSSYYLRIFPDWRNHVEVDNVDGINATDIRNTFFTMGGSPAMDDLMLKEWSPIPRSTVNWLQSWRNNNFDVAESLTYEKVSIKAYKESWEAAPYEPTFVTTDAVLTQSGYILLIKRGDFPYKDQWALPGGYLDMGQSIKDNMIKELREETCVKVPDKVLRGSIAGVEVFDDPGRDPRGRVITHGFHVDLGYPDEKLPKVKGADDAKEAKWFHLSDIHPQMMAFDHYHIIKHFIPTY